MKTEMIDGTGSGYTAKVDSENRVRTLAVTVSSCDDATDKGNSYNINTGLVTLTSAAESGILYIKNGEDKHLHLSSVVVILGPSTGGSATDTTRIRFYRNPTTGTLISNATAVADNGNRNFGSSNELTDTLAYAGATGNTVTDGEVIIESLVSPGNRISFDIDMVLPKGKSIAISLEPNDSNTSMKTMVAAICRLEPANG